MKLWKSRRVRTLEANLGSARREAQKYRGEALRNMGDLRAARNEIRGMREAMGFLVLKLGGEVTICNSLLADLDRIEMETYWEPGSDQTVIRARWIDKVSA